MSMARILTNRHGRRRGGGDRASRSARRIRQLEGCGGRRPRPSRSRKKNSTAPSSTASSTSSAASASTRCRRAGPVTPTPRRRRQPNAARGGGAAPDAGPCGGCPPGLVYEYDPGPDKWTKKKTFRSTCTTRRKRRSTGSCTSSAAACGDQRRGRRRPTCGNSIQRRFVQSARTDAGETVLGKAETVNGKIYVIGGLEPLENGMGTRVTGRNEMYDPATNTWTATQPDADVAQPRVLGRRGQQDLRHRRPHRRRQHPRDDQHRRRRGVRPGDEPVGRRSRIGCRRRAAAAAPPRTTARSTSAAANYRHRQLAAAFKALEAYDPASNTWEILPSMPSSRHGNAMGFIGNKLHVVSGKQEGGGAADMTGNSPHPYATEAHDVLEIPGTLDRLVVGGAQWVVVRKSAAFSTRPLTTNHQPPSGQCPRCCAPSFSVRRFSSHL